MVARQVLLQSYAQRELRYLQLMKGVMTKSIGLIEEYRLTEVETNDYEVLRSDDPDPNLLKIVEAKESVAQRHITISEGWWEKRDSLYDHRMSREVKSLWNFSRPFGGYDIACTRNWFAHSFNVGSSSKTSCDCRETFTELYKTYTQVLEMLDPLVQKLQDAVGDEASWVTCRNPHNSRAYVPPESLPTCALDCAEKELSLSKMEKERVTIENKQHFECIPFAFDESDENDTWREIPQEYEDAVAEFEKFESKTCDLYLDISRLRHGDQVEGSDDEVEETADPYGDISYCRDGDENYNQNGDDYYDQNSQHAQYYASPEVDADDYNYGDPGYDEYAAEDCGVKPRYDYDEQDYNEHNDQAYHEDEDEGYYGNGNGYWDQNAEQSHKQSSGSPENFEIEDFDTASLLSKIKALERQIERAQARAGRSPRAGAEDVIEVTRGAERAQRALGEEGEDFGF